MGKRGTAVSTGLTIAVLLVLGGCASTREAREIEEARRACSLIEAGWERQACFDSVAEREKADGGPFWQRVLDDDQE